MIIPVYMTVTLMDGKVDRLDHNNGHCSWEDNYSNTAHMIDLNFQ